MIFSFSASDSVVGYGASGQHFAEEESMSEDAPKIGLATFVDGEVVEAGDAYEHFVAKKAAEEAGGLTRVLMEEWAKAAIFWDDMERDPEKVEGCVDTIHSLALSCCRGWVKNWPDAKKLLVEE